MGGGRRKTGRTRCAHKQHGRWKTMATAERDIDSAGSVEPMAVTRSFIARIPYTKAMAAE